MFQHYFRPSSKSLSHARTKRRRELPPGGGPRQRRGQRVAGDEGRLVKDGARVVGGCGAEGPGVVDECISITSRLLIVRAKMICLI